MKTFHDAGWKNSYFNSADVYILVYGCGVSQHPRFYDKYLDMYQVLPRPYIRSFDGYPGFNMFPEKHFFLTCQV